MSKKLSIGGSIALWGAVLLCSSPIAAQPVKEMCDSLPPLPLRVTNKPSRTVTPDDLVRLRDIGMPDDSLPDQAPFSVSPDGQQVAFVLRQADPMSNSYCHGLFVSEIRPSGRVRQIDRGGDLIRYVIGNLRGMTFPSGIPAINTPKWSPDGRSVAYLKRLSGTTQAWIVSVSDGKARPATHSPIDIEGIDWAPGGGALIVASRPALTKAQESIDTEGRSGYRYDRRFMPAAGYRPFPPGSIPSEYFRVNLASGQMTPAPAPMGSGKPADASLVARNSAGRRAWIAPIDPKRFLSISAVFVDDGNRRITCKDERCRGSLTGIWWSSDGREIRYFRREGWANSLTALYRWKPGSSRPRRAFATQDVFSNCEAWKDQLICDRDASLEPRRIGLLDTATGHFQTIFDPNPEFDRFELGTVQRLQWRNANGVESFGDLILPPDHQPGERHPLIIVQYRTKGFLRGAVGDLYPLQSFAAAGFAVLSIERPQSISASRARPDDDRTADKIERDDTAGWIDRYNFLSTILTGIDRAAELGVVDRSRIGISGTSEAAVSAWFALINTKGIFSAASIGSCCIDPHTFFLLGGPALTESFREFGYPDSSSADLAFWKPISLALNADNITVPLLIQVPSDEFPLALESFKALSDKKRSSELYVFPDERHYIFQPAHRRSIYQRNLDWFVSYLMKTYCPYGVFYETRQSCVKG